MSITYSVTINALTSQKYSCNVRCSIGVLRFHDMIVLCSGRMYTIVKYNWTALTPINPMKVCVIELFSNVRDVTMRLRFLIKWNQAS